MPTLEYLCEQTGTTIDDIAERTKLPLKRVEAIALGRWTPSSEERRRIAEAFALPVEDIAWGHTMDPRNIRYHRFGFKKHFDS